MIFGRRPDYVMSAIRTGVSFFVIAGLLTMTAETMSSLFLFLEAILVLLINQELTPTSKVEKLAKVAQEAIDAKQEVIDAQVEEAAAVKAVVSSSQETAT